MRSKICSLLGIDFPLIAFSHCRDVVAEMSKAGGMGVLGLSPDDPSPLTVTGGLPYHGGAGNNYSMNAIATMADKLKAMTETDFIGTSGTISRQGDINVFTPD